MTRRCRHVCHCGAVLICGEPDKCAVGERFVCPACELDAIDRFLTAQEPSHPKESHADVRIGR